MSAETIPRVLRMCPPACAGRIINRGPGLLFSHGPHPDRPDPRCGFRGTAHRPGDLGRFGPTGDAPDHPPPEERRSRARRARALRGAGGDRDRGLRHSPLARRGREPARRPHPFLRSQVRAQDRPAGPLPRGNADLRRGRAPAAPPGFEGGRRQDRGGRPPGGFSFHRSAGVAVSAGRRFLRLGLLVGLLVFAVAFYLYFLLEHPRRPASPGEAVVFFPYGTPTTQIFHRLADERVVSPAWLAEFWYRLAESATPLQAGEYRFSRPAP